MFRGLTITTPAKYRRLTTLARVKSDLGVTSTGDDSIITRAIDDASAAVNTYCNRSFERQDYSEAGPAFGGIEFQCKNAPVVKLTSVLFYTSVLSDVSVGDREGGVLYRQGGFDWTAQRWGGLSGGEDRFLDFGHPIPGQEEPNWTVNYRAGYLVPDHDVTQKSSDGALTVLSSDNSINCTGGLFPSNLSDGDIIEVSGFKASANNGRLLVDGTPTSAKIPVSTGQPLTAETSTGTISFTFSNIPGDVEKAVRATAGAFYLSRKQPGTPQAIVERQLAVARVRYGEVTRDSPASIPPVAAGLLRPWVRVE